jgi:hypothetical protein
MIVNPDGVFMPTARAASVVDLEGLLDLFRASEVSAAVEPIEQAHEIWRKMRPRFLTPGRQAAITSCFKAAGRTLEYTASTSAAASSQDCESPMSLADRRSVMTDEKLVPLR